MGGCCVGLGVVLGCVVSRAEAPIERPSFSDVIDELTALKEVAKEQKRGKGEGGGAQGAEASGNEKQKQQDQNKDTDKEDKDDQDQGKQEEANQ